MAFSTYNGIAGCDARRSWQALALLPIDEVEKGQGWLFQRTAAS
jgi:hypothetical protein